MKSISNRRRIASTVLELLVVVALISVLTGLLLSAVQKVRATAERIRCANNLRQLALASHMYHDAEGSFPRGFSGNTFTANNPYPYMSWLTRLLPHIEQPAIWELATSKYNISRFPFNDTHLGVRDIPIPAFTCPADTRVQVAWIALGKRVALTSYLGVNGVDYRDTSGMLYIASRVRITDISDGSSNTLFFGERPPSTDITYGWWYAANGQDGTGGLDFILGVRERNISIRPNYPSCDPGPYSFQAGRIDNRCDTFHFWSLHSGGANFAFADGSVRFLSYTANDVMPALATRAGGEVVSIPD